jgi:hypothetical protein
LISYNIKANESIGYAKRRYNYKLGSWKLGELPFRTLLDRGIVKMSDVLSFNSKYLDDITIYSMSDISSILLNNSVSIVDITKTLVDHCGIVEYVVAKGTADAITNIKFLDSDQNVLTSSDVYVPLDADVEMKHTIVVKEGV